VQRILLARALYRQPKILVLDEATSQLDLANEQSVNQAVSEMSLTRLVVAHRPDTIAMADRVITMRAGQIEAAPASDMRAFGRSARPLDQR
jgi:ATP-binding cassette subfamily B protein RaxB